MKKFASILAIVLTVGSSAFATGVKKGKTSPAEKVNVTLVPYSNNKGITLKAANETNEAVSVSIYDITGETVFSEVIRTSPVIDRSYNLNSLPNGVYYVAVTTENYTVTKTLDIR